MREANTASTNGRGLCSGRDRASTASGFPGAALCLAALAALSLAAPAGAQRTVVETTIESTELPAASIRIDESMTYVGATSFDLYGVADAEIHIFVDAEEERVRRLLWVQFEGFHEDNDRTYDYSRDPTVDLEGRPFHVNARFYPTSGFGGRPGSDGDHAARLLREHGYRLGSDLARVRLVWLLDEPARNELMLIYLEDLADHDLSVDELEADEGRWRALAQELQERAFSTFDIETGGRSPAR